MGECRYNSIILKFLIIDEGEWPVSYPCGCGFTPEGTSLCIHWTAGWVDPSVGLGTVKCRKIFPLP
jgi:hypothetical protein